LVSDAGTPLISDPGYKLVQMCHDHDISVTCLPGPSSILPALLLSGFPPHPFMFCGFFASLQEWASVKATLIFFESPRRLVATLEMMKIKLPGRRVAVARELTKIYEECRRGSYEEVIDHYLQHPPKGEINIILGPPEKSVWDKNAIDLFIKEHADMKKTELTKEVMHRTGLSREDAYSLVFTSLQKES
jgi:16S rRNA (cytidine1402-2'-O)-methyltransferase